MQIFYKLSIFEKIIAHLIMKKFLIVATIFLVSASSLFAGGVSVKSGDVSVLKNPGKAKVVWDYSKTYVGEDGAKTKTLSQYLSSRGSEYVRDWPKDHAKAEEYFSIRFSKLNKKGLVVAEGKDKVDYLIEIKVEVLDMGNAAGLFIPMGGAKAGGVIMWGKVYVKNAKTKKTVLTLEIDEVKGKANPSESMRLGLCYMDLATRMARVR